MSTRRHPARRDARPVLPAMLADHRVLRDWQNARIAVWSRLLTGSIALAMIVVLARVGQLKVSPDPRLAELTGRVFSARTEHAPRGELRDRRGRVLATSTLGYRLFVDPQMVDDLPTIAADLALLIDADPIEIDRRLHERLDRQYVVIRQLLEPWQVDAVAGADLAGVGLEPRFVRHYPFGELAAGLIGRVGFEHTGLSGLESRFDPEMAPAPGSVRYLRDARKAPLWVDPAGYRPALPGAPVHLSIDLVIQAHAETRLRRAVEEFNAGGGRLVAMDSRTGEIVAMFDVLNPREDWDDVADDPLRALDAALARSRCVTDPYEPGSTFKPFVWAIATDLGRASADEELATPDDDEIFRTSYGRRIRDSHYYPDSTWRETLIHSLNTGMAIVAERLTKREMREGIRRFGFGQLSGAGLPGESRGLMTSAKEWRDHTQSSVAFGHEIAVTPVQMARAFCAFSGDGTVPTPRLTTVDPAEAGLNFLRPAISAETARQVRETLRDVIIEGTGWRAESKLYTLFGKSGTAQLPRKEGGGYHEHRYTSSFIAGAPFDDPRIVVICVIDDPDRAIGHWGGQVAAPVVKDVIEHALQYLGVAAEERMGEEHIALGVDGE